MTTPEPMSPATSDPVPPAAPGGDGPKRHRRRWFAISAVLVAIGSFFAGHASAHGGRRWHHGRRHPKNDAELREHLQRRADRVLSRLDATAEQRSKIDAILDRAAPRLFALRAEAHSLKDEARAALGRGDARALESVRQRGVALADRASKAWLDVLQELHGVLDERQRARMLEHFDHFGHHGRH